MRIQPGVKIFTKLECGEKIFLSNGIKRNLYLNGQKCNDDIFTPQEPWRKPTLKEYNTIIEKDNIPPYQSVGIIKLPEIFIQEFLESGFGNVSRKERFYQIISRQTFISNVNNLMKYLNGYKIKEDIDHTLNIGCFKSGLETITIDEKSNQYIGLHLDSWDRKSLNEKHLASNRICINFGSQKRSFLFINQEIKNLFKFVSEKEQFIKDDALLCQKFLSMNMDYSVTRIDLEPFEGYIAPTENILHDGSSKFQNTLDINLSIRSYFNCYHISEI